MFCAIVSHPADTIVSYMNKAQGSGVGDAAKALGFKGMWAGLWPRIIMIGTLTALQWFIYDFVKVSKSSYFVFNIIFNGNIFSGHFGYSSSTPSSNARLP